MRCSSAEIRDTPNCEDVGGLYCSDHELASSGGKAGANAIYYSIAFLITLLIAILAPIAALLVSPGYWLLLLPLLAVIAGPALLIASRANSPILFLRLCVLYFLYGLARAIDLLGLVPSKKTWKAR